MRHNTSIPHDLHTSVRYSVKDTLGAFWSSVYRDQDFVDSELYARILSAAQLHIDVMEYLSIRDHSNSPVFHREHWHPVLIKYSQRNTGRGLVIGMPDPPVIGSQPGGSIYLQGSIFEVGGNAELSKVVTYPFQAFPGCRMMRVRTCICDSISSPAHILIQGRDFDIDSDNGVLIVRREQDPFSVDGYRIVDDGDDRIAVLWACDADFDTDNVHDFIGYPLGISAPTTERSSEILSALWDVVIYGITPQYLNILLGALFGIPVTKVQERVESVTPGDGGMTRVVTDITVRDIPSANLSASVVSGAVLKPGSMLTDDIAVYHSLSEDEIQALVDDKVIVGLSLPPGSVLGVDSTVAVDSTPARREPGEWFKLNSGDSAESPFWQAVMSRTTEDDRRVFLDGLFAGAEEIIPLRKLGYTLLANTILVMTEHGMVDDRCAPAVFDMLTRLVPGYAAILAVQSLEASDVMAVQDAVTGAGDTVEHIRTKEVPVIEPDDQAHAILADDDVGLTFVPVAVTEV